MRAKRSTPRLHPFVAAVLACIGSADAATIRVNDAGEGSTPGKCTLRDAVAALNQAAPVNACAAGDGNADSIDLSGFTAATTITFTLPSTVDANSALVLSKPATLRASVDAAGNPLVTLTRSTVTGARNFRLIATSADLTIEGITISNGVSADRGGAIAAVGYATLDIEHAVLSANQAATSGGAVTADCGNVTLLDASLNGNTATKHGGGLYTSNKPPGGGSCFSNVFLRHAKVTGNTTINGNGGGVYGFNAYVYGYYSTIDGNVAGGGVGGGIYAYNEASLFATTVSNNRCAHYGGGVYTSNGSIVLRNSTVSGNYSIDGVSSLGARQILMYFSTVAGNLVGPRSSPIASVSFITRGVAQSTIITGNAGGNIIGETQLSGDHNIIGANLGNQSVTLPPDTRNCDAKLGPLAANGGPTMTMALLDGSCALNTGPSTSPGLASDQRGSAFARRVGSAVDVGAFEANNDRIFFGEFESGP